MDKKRPSLTPDLLRRYAAGELTPAEQHAVERRLLDDPLAAEAVEGLARLRENEVNVETATADLRARLQHRAAKRRGRVVPLAWTRYAAAATVLLAVAGLGWWWLRTEPTAPEPGLTASRPAPEAAQPQPAAEPAPAPAAPPEMARARSSPPQATPKRRSESRPETFADIAEQAPTAAAPPPEAAKAETEPTVTAAQRDETAQKREAPPTAPAPQAAPAMARRALTGPRFTGRVIGENQQPVTGAVVTSVTTRQSVRTDNLGKFSLPEPPPNDRLRITARGYQPLEVAVRDTAVGTLNLQPAPAARAKAVAPVVPRPVEDGSETRFPAFDDYARAHRRVAGQGTVRLSFRLGPGGKPRQVRIEASDNPALNTEAIRLLREGPGWSDSPVVRRRGRVVYGVRFE